MNAICILKTADVASLLGCSEYTVEERARTGDLPGLKFGEEGWIFPAGALMERLNEKAKASAQERRQPTVAKAVSVQTLSKRKLPTLPSLVA